MLAFIVVIGPVNMLYLNRIKRRTWMLWTIPAISFATTLLVFAYSLLREGITPDTRITGLTVLDQASHHAATIGGTAFYCPLTPSGGLHFEFGTEATPLVRVGYGSGTSREVDWTQAQHFQRGWVSARVPAHFHLRKIRDAPRTHPGGQRKWKIANRQRPGRADQVALDRRCEHELLRGGQCSRRPKSGIDSLKNRRPLEKCGASGLLRDLGFAGAILNRRAENYLQPNTYIAVLDGNPFIENALGAASSPKRTRSACVVFGILEANEKK